MLHHQVSAAGQRILHGLHRKRGFQGEEVLQAGGVEKLGLRDTLLRFRARGQVAGGAARGQRLAQTDQLRHHAAGVLARIVDDLHELGEAVFGELAVVIRDGLSEVLGVLRHLVADVVNLLRELAVPQHGGSLVHRKPSLETPVGSDKLACYATGSKEEGRRAELALIQLVNVVLETLEHHVALDLHRRGHLVVLLGQVAV